MPPDEEGISLCMPRCIGWLSESECASAATEETASSPFQPRAGCAETGSGWGSSDSGSCPKYLQWRLSAPSEHSRMPQLHT
jgi:hypothetical protein